MATSSRVDRRNAASMVNTGHPYADASHVVRQGIVIQSTLGTRSAVEFLKRHGVHGAVIHRVLTGDQVRGIDQLRRHDQPALDGDVAIDDPRM